MIGEFLTAIWKYFNGWNFYLDILQIQKNWAGRNLITNSRVSIRKQKMQTENQQQLTDGGILANRNSANHSYCFLSNQKKVQILAFLHVICKRNVSCPLPESSLQRQRERAWSQANSKVTWYLQLRFVITSKTPDLLRRVYDASAKFRCQRLNDKMYTEPDYLSSLFGVLLRFCELKEG